MIYNTWQNFDCVAQLVPKILTSEFLDLLGKFWKNEFCHFYDYVFQENFHLVHSELGFFNLHIESKFEAN